MIKAASIFSNHCVLQRNKVITIMGEASGCNQIKAGLYRGENLLCSGEGYVNNGSWRVSLPPQQAAEKLRLEITSDSASETDRLVYTDIAVGEVWLAGGQSNMEYELANAIGGRDLLQNPDETCRSVRFYYTPKLAYFCDEYEKIHDKSSWELFDREQSAKWSAVGFLFAKELADRLGVTVGVIGCNWGGTSASCWMSREKLMEVETLKIYVEEYESDSNANKTVEEQIGDYNDYLSYHADWEEKANKIYEKEPMAPFDEVQKRIGPCKYPGPRNICNFTRPYGLHETMIKKIAPVTIAGCIYYQGESDDHRPDSYDMLLRQLIRQWREDFEDDELPFMLVQLPMHRYRHDPDTKSWCVIREAQMRVARQTGNCGIAVCIDCGEFHEIHPKDKRQVAHRLALQALMQVYNAIDIEECNGPIINYALHRGNGVDLFFHHADTFCIHGDNEDKSYGFELAGLDEQYKPADVVALSDIIHVESSQVIKPAYVRFLWTNYGEVSLYGSNGIPIAPFRLKL